jgi:transposase
MTQSTKSVAGIDVAKSHLDLALGPEGEVRRFPNTLAGWRAIAELVDRHGVERVGLEATGGHEAGVAAHLRAAEIAVTILQPIQVRAFARVRLRRAKNDRLDARLIAAFLAEVDPPQRVHHPKTAALLARLTFLEQTEDDMARLKIRREHVVEDDLKALVAEDLARLKARRAALLADLVTRLQDDPDLARRLELLVSIPGIGRRTAVALIVRLPELGDVSREEIAALAGLAPYDRDSGASSGARHIAGGRARVRKSLFAATMPAAYRWNEALVTFRDRLLARNKPPKVALIACARKLLVFANAVIARGSPWTQKIPA